MSDKKFVVGFSSVLLLSLATGTAWGNAPITSTTRISRGQPAPVILDNGTTSGELKSASMPRQNDGMASKDVVVATLEINLLSQNPGVRSMRNRAVVSPVSGQASSLPANKNSAYSTFARTGNFGGEEERVNIPRPAGRVRTGVFWTPEGSPGGAQDDVLKSGFWGAPGGPGVTNGTGDRRGAQGRQLRKRGKKSGNW